MIDYSLDDFGRSIRRHKGLAPSNRAVAFFTNPITEDISVRQILTQVGLSQLTKYNDPRELAFLCTDIVLPSSNIMTQEYRDTRHTRSVAHSLIMNEVQMSFIITNDHYALRFFRAWQNSIINKTTYRLNYHEEYSRDIVIITFNSNHIPTTMYKVKNAFPTTISEITISHTAIDEVLKVSVTFKYDDFLDGINEIDYELLAYEALTNKNVSKTDFFKTRIKDVVGQKLADFVNL